MCDRAAPVVVDNFGRDMASVPRRPLHVVLDNLRSAYNVGSIFRTADAALVEKVYTCGISAHPPNLKLRKTSLGAARFVPWEHFTRTMDAVSALRSRGIPVYAFEVTDRSRSLFATRFRSPAAVVFGNELAGVSGEVLAAADEIVAIPMGGFKNSVNVSVAAGVAIFEIVRQFTSGQA
jgi:tRNA G18 (ribose-2'-O)-methylase SpoU